MLRIDAIKTGKKINQYARNKKLKRYELAEKLGCSSAIVTYWYQGRNLPTLDYIVNMCRLFNCKFEDLIVLCESEGEEE